MMNFSQKTTFRRMINSVFPLLLVVLLPVQSTFASEDETVVVEVKLGDYRFMPEEIKLTSGQPAVLRLVNTDKFTPHNFSMDAEAGSEGIDVDVPRGKTVDIQLPPLAPGEYTFYCASKLLFMKSHRDKCMVGRLIISPE